MVDQKSPGVIVLSLVVLAVHFYFFLQDPRRIRTILSSFTTYLLIIGYALEVGKIGVNSIEQSGQQYLPVYQLAPYRILVTFIGVVLAFIFTIFPFPVTSGDILRQDTARQFHLFSSLYSLTRSRMGVVVVSDGTRESAILKKMLGKVGEGCIVIQGRCMENLMYTKWEPNLRHRFPAETYEKLLTAMQSLFELYIIQNDAISRMKGSWLHAIRSSLGPDFFQSQSHSAISLLNILSGSLSLDTPLPPFLKPPGGVSFRILMAQRLPEELGLEHVGENGYAVFAAIAVSSRLASLEVQRCVGLVRDLVGEVDMKWDVTKAKEE